jgi:MarR family transcriptional regulator, organic hydroperoxide resistance regulator
MVYEQLKLENQVCFPIYAVSRLIIREYTPLLNEIGLTYPQYLVMMLLWETDGLTVNEITDRLLLNTNTVTPLLKRMESQGLLVRQRSKEDERRVIARLTSQGMALREKAASIPERLVTSLASPTMSVDELNLMVSQMHTLIKHLAEKHRDNATDVMGDL